MAHGSKWLLWASVGWNTSRLLGDGAHLQSELRVPKGTNSPGFVQGGINTGLGKFLSLLPVELDASPWPRSFGGKKASKKLLFIFWWHDCSCCRRGPGGPLLSHLMTSLINWTLEGPTRNAKMNSLYYFNCYSCGRFAGYIWWESSYLYFWGEMGRNS